MALTQRTQYAYFSAAIRDGAKLRPQGFQGFFIDGKSCAYAAGYEAMYDSQLVINTRVTDEYPYMLNTEVQCNERGCQRSFSLSIMIVHLNDTHFWTREEIADWLYAEEEKLGFVTLIETEGDSNGRSSSQRHAEISACNQVETANSSQRFQRQRSDAESNARA